jgi:hypothetical protein
MFESALKKIELEDFVIHDKVDDFLKHKEEQRQEKAHVDFTQKAKPSLKVSINRFTMHRPS